MTREEFEIKLRKLANFLREEKLEIFTETYGLVTARSMDNPKLKGTFFEMPESIEKWVKEPS